MKAYFAANTKGTPERDIAKRVVHLSNYMGTPRKMAYEYPETFKSVADAQRLQGLYFDLFPEIRRWHRELCHRVDGTKQRKSDGTTSVDPWSLGVCYARNPFGYVHHFYNVLDWEKVDAEWIASYGEDAKRLVSFLPQSTAAAIIKQAAKAIWREFPDVGRTLRLLIHDSLLGECEEKEAADCLAVAQEVMGRPILELPLDPSWGMGTHLTINSDAKVGRSWGEMK
jgi:hypothetical protein